MKKIISNIGLMLSALLFLVGCTDINDFASAQRELTLTATMPTDNIVTRIMMKTNDDSKNLSATWLENDNVNIIITQGDNKYDIGLVRPYNISEDSKRADLTIRLPEELDIDQTYTIYAFCNLTGVVTKDEDGNWQAYGTAGLQRARIYFLIDVPIFACVDVRNNQIPAIRFQHIGTYELLHVTNATAQKISFKHKGFECESDKWYWKDANIKLSDGTITTGSYGEVDNEYAQYDVYPGETEYFLSWYLPSGKKLNKARLKANIDGQEVTSVNTKTSDVTVECGHVYHLYATWDGQKLRFDNGDFVESRTYTLSCEEVNFGQTKVGETYHDYFVIKNTGNVPQTFVVEATHGEFEIEKSGKTIELVPNDTEAIGVDFKPEQYDHNYQQSVRITCEGSEGPQYIVLKGQTEAKAEEIRTYTVTPETLEFGLTTVGTTYSRTFAIKNTGNVPLQFLIDATHEEFEIQQSGSMFEVKPNDTQTIIVLFKPQNYNTNYQKEVSIFCYEAQGPKKIVLTAQTRPQENRKYTVSPLEIDFGTTEVGETKESSFLIENTGNVALTVTIQATHDEFEIAKSGQSIQLEPNQSATIGVTFTPEEFDTDYQKVVHISGDGAEGPQSITLKGHTETRIDQVIPPDIREKLEDHITIYEGVNPPNVEGEYVITPLVLTYDSEFNYDIGDVFADSYIKLYNQNRQSNTIDYLEEQGSGKQTGQGAFISGEGNNFSIFFNTKGVIHMDLYDINTKHALIISGTKTATGIQNIEYAFVMVDKSSDPKPYLIPIGAFRSFKDGDGFTEMTTWTSAVKAMKAKAAQRGGKFLPNNNELAPMLRK